jgi:hypothetical protein
MSRIRLWLVAGLVVLGTGIYSVWPSQAAVGPLERATVRLYSNGQVVGQWDAIGPGRIEGDTFVFPVRQGVKDLEVRIRGTFTYEEQP